MNIVEPTQDDQAAANFVRPRSEVLSRLLDMPAANVADAMERLSVVDGRVHAMWQGMRVVGPALTVLVRPGDNLLIHRAVGVAKPGDVIVVSGGADESRALIGEVLSTRASQRGVGGFVIDGAVRDIDELKRIGLPVFARGLSPAGPFKFGPGHIGRAVAVGGTSVSPGDIVVGDSDGVVIIPLSTAEVVVRDAEAIVEAESRHRASVGR